jgi:hypothetical protein
LAVYTSEGERRVATGEEQIEELFFDYLSKVLMGQHVFVIIRGGDKRSIRNVENPGPLDDWARTSLEWAQTAMDRIMVRADA